MCVSDLAQLAILYIYVRLLPWQTSIAPTFVRNFNKHLGRKGRNEGWLLLGAVAQWQSAWHGKPKALGSTPGISTFLSCSFAISKVAIYVYVHTVITRLSL